MSVLIGLFVGIFVNLGLAFGAEPKPWEMYFQPPASPVMRAFNDFHIELLVIITLITLFVSGLLFYVIVKFNRKSNPNPDRFTHNVKLEIIWTVIPVIILAYIAIPSFKTLYLSENAPNSELTIKVVGHQWYWEYEYPSEDGSEPIKFDSYYIKDADLQPGQKRLLDVDNQLVLPIDTNIKILLTSADVIHAFGVPALGVKMDSVPGRLNQTWTKIEKEGVYYGQCYQLCGVNHAFMPIAIKAVSKDEFKDWLKNQKAKLSGNFNQAKIN